MSSKSYTEYERPIDVTRKSLTVCTVYIIYRPLSEPFKLGTLQAVTYTLKVVVSKKWRKIDTLLLHTTNRKK